VLILKENEECKKGVQKLIPEYNPQLKWVARQKT
jgi:hypothetical protein